MSNKITTLRAGCAGGQLAGAIASRYEMTNRFNFRGSAVSRLPAQQAVKVVENPYMHDTGSR